MTARGHRLVVVGLTAVLASVWLGFVVHRAPRFAGSRAGGLLGIVAAALMLVPVLYAIVRHVPGLRRAITPSVPLATLLRVHITCGLVGPILAVIHTGHRFEHPLGIALTATVLVVATSGFIGHELLRRTDDGKAELATLRAAMQTRFAEGAVRETASLASAIADLELTGATHDRARRWLQGWRAAHLVLTAVLFALLAVHVWTAFYFGVRW